MGFELRGFAADRTLQVAFPIESELVTIGRDPSCDLVLSRPAVSKKHAMIRLVDGQHQIRDLDSSTGLLINNSRVKSHTLQHGDKILIADVFLTYASSNAPAAEGPSQNQIDTLEINNKGRAPGERVRTVEFQNALPTPAFVPNKATTGEFSPQQAKKKRRKLDDYTKLRAQIHQELVRRMHLERLRPEQLEDDELRLLSQPVADEIIYELNQQGKLPRGIALEKILKDVLDDTHGLGPIQDLIEDPTVEEIMVNGPDVIYVARRGAKGLQKTDRRFIDEEILINVINRILSPINRQINQSRPMVDGRLPKDGSRINAIIPPISLIGPVLTIRKFPEKPLTPQDLVNYGSCSPAMMKFFQLAIHHKQNIVVAGGTGAGKTTLLNVLSSFIDSTDRIITIEDSAELQLQQPHVVSLETRAGSLEREGVEEITIRKLMRNALRMRPDRIIVGECRGEEAIDMLQAMNTGHDGSMTTGHANGTRDMLSRLETMVLMAGLELPLTAIRDQVSRAIQLIVFVERFPDGKRRITQVSEIAGLDTGEYVVNDIYTFEYNVTHDGQVTGRYIPTGNSPRFIEREKSRGATIPDSIFEEG